MGSRKVNLQLFAELLRRVIAYYEGRGKYNFSHLSNYDRDNAAFDAWQEIRQEIKEALRDYNAQKRKTVDKKDFNSEPGRPKKTDTTERVASMVEEAWKSGGYEENGLSAALTKLAVEVDWESGDPKFIVLEIANIIGGGA